MKLVQLRNRSLVCDTTCLLYLGRIGQLDLLPALFEKVVVPSQVALELDMGRFLRADTCDCRRLTWANVVDVSPSDIESLPSNRLGEGERAVIAYAMFHRDHLACLDDRLARRFAEELGLTVMGIVGIMVVAKRERRIDDVATVLEHLKREGFRLGDDVITKALQLAEEES